MSVAGAADARPRTKTRGEIALATALEEEEVKLLAAEEDTLLLRRSSFFCEKSGALRGVRGGEEEDKRGMRWSRTSKELAEQR